MKTIKITFENTKTKAGELHTDIMQIDEKTGSVKPSFATEFKKIPVGAFKVLLTIIDECEEDTGKKDELMDHRQPEGFFGKYYYDLWTEFNKAYSPAEFFEIYPLYKK